jgi:glycosyltransferase involved in cell wall biosynthesis
MKIGFDLTQCSTTRAGGGWYAYSLLQALAKISPETQFLAYSHFCEWFNPPDTAARLLSRQNITDPFAGVSIDQAISVWSDSIRMLRAPGDPELVHSTSFQSPRLASSKLVVTIYDVSFWIHPEFTTDRIRLDCQRGVLDAIAHADGLIFISEHSRNEFHRLIPRFYRRPKMLECVTPLGSRLPLRAGLDESEATHWLAVGTLEPRKNILNLLDGYALYAANHATPKPLLMAGPIGWKNDLFQSKLKALESRNLVRLLGYVDDSHLAKLYQNAQALIFPSWYEGFGLPVLEALTQGCAVIASNRSSLPEIAGASAIYVDPAEPGQIASAMLRLERDPTLRRTLRESGLARASEFSWEKTAKRTLAFYDDVLSAV